MSSSPAITIRHVRDYQFTVDFGAAIPQLLVDEAEPIGAGEGPSPEQMLVAGVTNCLCASMIFALGKFKQDARGLEATSRCIVERNDGGRLRITRIEVEIALAAAAADMERIDRVLAQFRRFCTVSESVEAGIPVDVAVRDGTGRTLP